MYLQVGSGAKFACRKKSHGFFYSSGSVRIPRSCLKETEYPTPGFFCPNTAVHEAERKYKSMPIPRAFFLKFHILQSFKNMSHREYCMNDISVANQKG